MYSQEQGEVMRKIIWLALAIGCGGDAKDTGEDDAGGDSGGGGSVESGSFDDYINTSVTAGGDLSCYTGTTPAPDVLGAGCDGHTRTMSAEVSDFQTDNPVDEASVEIFLGDGIFGIPDHALESDLNGMISAAMPTCMPFTYRVSTDPSLDQTKVTIESHDVLPFSTVDVVTHEMNSVSSATYALIPALIGLSPDVEKGIVAGVAYDCAETAMSGVQVLVRDSSGTILEGAIIGNGAVGGVKTGYFVDEYPSRDQLETSEDGIFVLVDVPVGVVTVEAYIADGAGAYRQLSATTLEVLANSINIASIHAGISDGVRLPDSCREICPIP
jgi:hypothetical protein